MPFADVFFYKKAVPETSQCVITTKLTYAMGLFWAFARVKSLREGSVYSILNSIYQETVPI